jgi:hypothetical protein
MKKKIIRPSPAEDAVITKAALSDPDNLPLTEEEWNEIKKCGLIPYFTSTISPLDEIK